MRKCIGATALGLVMAMAVLLGSCSNSFTPSNGSVDKSNALSGKGTVKVVVDGGNDFRTALPTLDGVTYKYFFAKVVDGEVGEEAEKLPEDDAFTLEIGDYVLRVEAYKDSALAGSGSSEKFTIKEGETLELDIDLNGNIVGVGSFAYAITGAPEGSTINVGLFAYPYTGAEAVASAGTESDTLDVAAGYYWAFVVVTSDGAIAQKSEIVHIYNGLTTNAKDSVAFVAGNFVTGIAIPEDGFTVGGVAVSGGGDTAFIVTVPYEDSGNGLDIDLEIPGTTITYGKDGETYTDPSLIPLDEGQNDITIIVTANDGTGSKEFPLVVIVPNFIPVTGIDGVTIPSALTAGETINLSAAVIVPAEPTTKAAIVWSKEGTATLDGNIVTAAEGSFTLTATVAGGLKTGAYTQTWTVTVGPAPVWAIDNISGKDFGEAIKSSGSYAQPEALTVTVTNSGNQPTGALTVALSGAQASSFTLSAGTLSSIAAGSSDTFTVQPKAALTAGTHTATITVSGENGISKSSAVTFKVTDAAVGTNVITVEWTNPLDDSLVEETVEKGDIVDLASPAVPGATSYKWYLGKAEVYSGQEYAFPTADKLEDRTYDLTLVVEKSGVPFSKPFKITVTPKVEVVLVSSFELDQADITFATLGATSAFTYTQPAAQTVTIHNTGDTALTLSASKNGTGSGDFTLGAITPSSIAAGATGTFTVRPNASLAEGNHFAEITVSGSEVTSQSFKVSFTNRHTSDGFTGIFDLFARNTAAQSQYGGDQARDEALASFEGESPVLKIAPAPTNAANYAAYSWGFVNYHPYLPAANVGKKVTAASMKVYVVGTSGTTVQFLWNTESNGSGTTVVNATVPVNQWVEISNTAPLSYTIVSGKNICLDAGTNLAGKTFYIADCTFTIE